jgi:hypothetical protein
VAAGPDFRKFERVFDRLIEILALNEGCFDRYCRNTPSKRVDRNTPSNLANAHQPAGRNPWRELASPGVNQGQERPTAAGIALQVAAE